MTTSGEIGVDSILDFFRTGETNKVVHTNVTATGGQGFKTRQHDEIVNKHNAMPSYKRANYENYAQKYIDHEEKEMLSMLHKTTISNAEGTGVQSLMSVEEVSSMGGIADVDGLQAEETIELFRRYHTKHKYNSSLAITRYKEKIISMIEAYQVVVIEGATGCGKTTQVPQYILDKYASEQRHCNIVVTQPRRIAAISIANRVCDERGWSVGDLVGYQVGMNRNTSENTRLTYMTTGVLLQKLVAEKRMDQFTHVIIDEVHERDQLTDFVLLVVRKFLRTVSRGVKVILMSATFDTDMFAQYFALPVLNKLEPAPIISVQGKTFSVAEYFLNDYSALGALPVLDIDTPSLPIESYRLAGQLINLFDRIETEENNYEFNEEDSIYKVGTVLVFLPGIFEIQEMEQHLTQESAYRSKPWHVIPLHSTVTMDEQRQVFVPPQPNIRKIILATNIAESSITVPDIKYVIDFCLTKHLVCDPETHYTCLELNWASKANCLQRKGRAGRVSNGRVYRLIPKEMYDRLSDYGQPEMTRCPLESTVLKVKQLDLGEPKAILALALKPPAIVDIERSIILLKEVGALAMTINGFFSPHDGDLTFIGQIMASLPLDIRLSKLIVYGFALNCLERCIIIASCLSCKSFFKSPFHQALKAYIAKQSWTLGHFSDPITSMNAYEVWQSKMNNGEFQRPGGQSEKQWCHKNFIQMRRLHDVQVQVQDLKMRLEQNGITCPSDSQYRHVDTSEDLLVLKLVICGAFYPNYFLSDIKDEDTVNRELIGRSPLSTVVFSNLPQSQGIIYAIPIRSELNKHCKSDVELVFQGSKAYADFESRSGDHSNRILPAVYFALKMRQLRVNIELPKLSQEESETMMRTIMSSFDQDKNQLNSSVLSVSSSGNKQAIPKCELPDLQTTTLEIRVTHIEDCGSFWAQAADYDSQSRDRMVAETIAGMRKEPITGPLTPGSIVLAPYGNQYFRARIEATTGSQVLVFFVDYGNSANVAKSHICGIDATKAPFLLSTPCLAFQCALSEIRPSAIKSLDGTWPPETRDMLADFMWNQPSARRHQFKIIGKIYSIIHDVIRMELNKCFPNQSQISFNEHLISLKLAEKAEEGPLSRQNNTYRQESYLRNEQPSFQTEKSISVASLSQCSLTDGRTSRHARSFKLRGPNSPLEFMFGAMTRAGIQKAAKIEMDSVNSIALDSEPWDQHQKLMVAAHIDLTSTHGNIKARSTTLMPNIHGLASLVCLLFAPKMELRADDKLTHLTGALCGLGVDEFNDMPFYPDHDVEVIFDVKISTQDVHDINSVRMALNLILSGDNHRAAIDIEVVRKTCRKNLIDIISRERKLIERQPFKYPFKWNCMPENYLLFPEIGCDPADCSYVLPLHCAVALNNDDYLRQSEEQRKEMRQHLNDLAELAKKRSPIHEEIKCKLCDSFVYSCQELVIHLISNSHGLAEKEFFGTD